MGCEITVELHSCYLACQCCSAQSYTFFSIYSALFAPLSQHSKNKKWCRWHAGGMLPLGSNQAITNGEGMEGLLFCFVLFFFQCDIEFLALGCTSGQTIIAFSSLGSSLFSIWSLPPSDFTIRGRGGSRGEEDNSWISHLIWAAREAGRTLTMSPEIACQGLPGTQKKNEKILHAKHL